MNAPWTTEQITGLAIGKTLRYLSSPAVIVAIKATGISDKGNAYAVVECSWGKSGTVTAGIHVGDTGSFLRPTT